MDSHVDSTPGLGLPQPSTEQGAAAFAPYQETYRAPEAASAVAENAPRIPQAAPPLPPMAQVPAAGQPQAATGMPPATTAQAPGLVPADDDSDALDEEWVNKAKAIVEQTKADPYIESKELGRAKADYLRIRYNKQIKVAEDQ
ncbi:MAG TPA: hypothetical protein VLF62_05410 [Candidatus Saccharimonadales bacterium]|jgi:hypothetical protein|nr:hypothetical protein [Candidatus Saccharimonadales bacterium]